MFKLENFTVTVYFKKVLKQNETEHYFLKNLSLLTFVPESR